LLVDTVFLFCFCRSRPPRDLHSFPTRRSSDLEAVGADGEPRERPGAGRVEPADLPRTQREAEVQAVPDVDDPVDDALERVLEEVDRKSTRLNSSHVKISYAVFCLKKKTQSKKN